MGGHSTNDDGFIMVDALTGLVIVSLMIGVCLATVKIGRSFSEASQDMRASQALMQSLMEGTPRVPGYYTGMSAGMPYEVKVKNIIVGSASLCQIVTKVKSPDRRRTYKLMGTRWCAERAL